MADGPQCVRNDTHSTLYPCGIALAATWDRSLAHSYGRSLGRDARARGVHIMLGPGVNIYRSPLCGRNFEYYGEDPYLASETASAYIAGMQGEGVMATVKHFCGNNQEYDRHHVSSDIDERTLHEIYLPMFRKAVEQAGVGAVMSSYNLVNGQHMTENRDLAVGVLRERWGFEGIFMSDWDATYSVAGPVNNGLDLEMPGARYTNPENLQKLLAAGVVTEETIDAKCRHILQTLIAFGFLDREQKDASIPERNPESDATALEVARNSMVLLKNDGLLPFGRRTRRVVVLGPNAVACRWAAVRARALRSNTSPSPKVWQRKRGCVWSALRRGGRQAGRFGPVLHAGRRTGSSLRVLRQPRPARSFGRDDDASRSGLFLGGRPCRGPSRGSFLGALDG